MSARGNCRKGARSYKRSDGGVAPYRARNIPVATPWGRCEGARHFRIDSGWQVLYNKGMNTLYFDLREKYGVSHLPDMLERYYAPKSAVPLFDRSWLADTLARFGVTGERAHALTAAIDAIEADEGLCAFTNFAVEQACAQRTRLDGEHINITRCSALGEAHEPFYPMIVLLACVPVASAACEARGIGAEQYGPTLGRMMKGVLGGYGRSGKTKVSFAWSANFFTCALFQFDRFYFVPHKYDADYTVLRHKATGQVRVLMPAGAKIRSEDGQYDGVSDFHSAAPFTTVRDDTDEEWVGNPVSPVGTALPELSRLPKSEWEQTVSEGDAFLALHIPGGPGYTPEHLKESSRLAIEFYDKYYPELRVRGIWSESWLYDPHLRELLSPESGIIRMQDRMYCMPFSHGHASIYGELHHSDPPSSLERAVKEYEERGGTFASCYMFILREDIDRIGDGVLYDAYRE